MGSTWLVSGLSEPFCRAHQGQPSCRICAAPIWRDRLCRGCHGDAIWSQDQVKAEVPLVREHLHAIGMRLLTPVRVRLVPVAEIPHLVSGITTAVDTTVIDLAIASGLVRMEFGATVVHECMHAWMIQRGFPRMTPQVNEGICQLMAYVYLRRHAGDGRADIVARSMRGDPDPVYGEGFRQARAVSKQYGVSAVVDSIRQTGQLPDLRRDI